MQKRSEEIPVSVRICDKRLLSVPEFCTYASVGRNRAMDLAQAAGAVSRMGRRVLIDRAKFDAYCNYHEVLL